MYDGRRRQRRSCLGCDKGNEKDCIGILRGGGMGFILLFLVYMIPTEPMIENARASIDIFKIEGAFAQNIHDINRLHWIIIRMRLC